jgi:ABC-2 type transport system ATP-binding protein
LSSSAESSNGDNGTLEFSGVSKWYGQVSALMDVGFRLAGGVVGLVGQNGAGKSTLMKLAAGLLQPSQGLVLLCGGAPSTPGVRRRLGFAMDLEQLPEHLSGQRFVAWLLRLTGYGRASAWSLAGERLGELGLADVMGRKISTYSKGMRQRVRLAQALAHDPQVVLLDEPMSGLDPVARHELAGQIRGLGERGVTVMVSSHVLHELEHVAERILLLHQGRLMAEGTVANLRQQLQNRPHRLLLISDRPRELGTRLASLEQVSGIRITGNGVELETGGQDGFYGELTAIGAEAGGLIAEILPLDDSLEAVFGYLVG